MEASIGDLALALDPVSAPRDPVHDELAFTWRPACTRSMQTEVIMKENVGRIDQVARSIIGPALMAIGYTRLGARHGRLPGLATLIGGALLIDSAITRVCPMNALLGLDTRSQRDRQRDTLERSDALMRDVPLH